MNRHSLLPLATLQIFYVGFAVAQSPGVNDSHGKVWRQLTETTGVSWNQLSQVCPRDGLTPCSGLAGGRDLTGWVWATGPQVTQLFGYYEPAVLASPTSSVSGFNYFFTASTFLSAFRPTESVALTYSASQFAAGWTASTDAATCLSPDRSAPGPRPSAFRAASALGR